MRHFIIAILTLSIVSMASTVQAASRVSGGPCDKKMSALYKSGKVASSCRAIHAILNALSHRAKAAYAAGNPRCAARANRYRNNLQKKKNLLCRKTVKKGVIRSLKGIRRGPDAFSAKRRRSAISDMISAGAPGEELKCSGGVKPKCTSKFAFPCPTGWSPCPLEGENKTCCKKN